jgi:hypothetical protein
MGEGLYGERFRKCIDEAKVKQTDTMNRNITYNSFNFLNDANARFISCNLDLNEIYLQF